MFLFRFETRSFLVLLVFAVSTFLVISATGSMGNTANIVTSRNSSYLRGISSSSLSTKMSASDSAATSHMLRPWSVIPPLLYGTAWKKDRTEHLVELAIQTGFRGIDTACQPKHYSEPGVGRGLQKAYARNLVTRKDLFLQTKFTSLDGQDPNNIPYDKTAPLKDQVMQSFKKSLENLHTEYLDSLVLHSPMRTFEDTMTVWRVFESFVQSGQVKYLGISNIYDYALLRRIHQAATVKPKFIQNRFYKQSGYDKEIRLFVQENDMVYQSFWTLTANPHILQR